MEAPEHDPEELSAERDSQDINRETAEEHEKKGGRFERESGAESSVVEGSEAGPGSADIDEDLEDRGDA